MNLLPGELLPLIFISFPARPLVHVISLVCKRWRRAACLAIRFLPPKLSARLPPQVASSLPGLDQWHSRRPHPIPTVLRSQIRTLDFAAGLREAAELPALTSLTFSASELRDLLTGWIRSPHLTYLRTNTPVFGVACMTALTSLTFDTEPYSRASTLLCDHLSLLTSLSVAYMETTDMDIVVAAASQLTRLRSLTIRPDSDLPRFISCVNALPALASLSILKEIPFNVLSRLHRKSVLQSMHISGELTANELCELTAYSGLREFRGPWAAYAVIGSQLTSLSLDWHATQSVGFSDHVMKHCTALTSLHMRPALYVRTVPWPAVQALFSWKLPYLRHVDWTYYLPYIGENNDLRGSVEVIWSVIHSWKTLKTATLVLFQEWQAPIRHDLCDAAIIARLVEVFELASQIGMEELDLGTMHPIQHAAFAEIYRPYKWLYVHSG